MSKKNEIKNQSCQLILGHYTPSVNYRVIAVRHDEFTPSEIDFLKYETYTEFPLVKVLEKGIVRDYNENRARIKSAFVINKQIKDTILVEFSFNGNKVEKRVYKSNRAKNKTNSLKLRI